MKKLAIIGCGEVASMMHIPAAKALLPNEHIFLVESDVSQHEELKKAFGLSSVFSQLDELPDISHVILATPPHTHAFLIEALSSRTVEILCEKPMVHSKSDLDRMQNLSDSVKSKIYFCHTYRFFPNRIFVKDLLQKGFFGDEFKFVIKEGEKASWNPRTGYNFRKEMVDGGVVLDAGIHSLDFVLNCLGMPTLVNYIDDALGALESNATFSMTFDQGNAIYKLSRTHSLSNTLELTGNGHQLIIDLFEFDSYTLDGKKVEIQMENPIDWSNIGQVQLDAFLSKDVDPRKTVFEEAFGLMRLIFDSYEQKRARPLPSVLPLPAYQF